MKKINFMSFRRNIRNQFLIKSNWPNLIILQPKNGEYTVAQHEKGQFKTFKLLKNRLICCMRSNYGLTVYFTTKKLTSRLTKHCTLTWLDGLLRDVQVDGQLRIHSITRYVIISNNKNSRECDFGAFTLMNKIS